MTPDDVAISSMLAEWFAAIGTVGALGLALLLLLRDRIHADRLAADAFVTWLSREYYGKTGSQDQDVVYVIHSYNAGDAPVAMAYAHYGNPETGRTEGFMLGAGHKGISPRSAYENRTSKFGATAQPSFYVVFRDRHGKQWVRDVEKGEYVRWPRKKSIIKPAVTFV